MRIFASALATGLMLTTAAAFGQERLSNDGGLGLDLSATHASAYRTELEYRPAAEIGLGWDSLNNVQPSALTTCLEIGSISVSSKEDIETKSVFRLVESKTDTMDTFGLNASAAFRSVGFSVDGSLEYATSRDVATGRLHVAGRVDISRRTDTANSPDGKVRIARAKLALLESGDIDAFLDQCGDSFVYQIKRGGKLSIMLDVQTASETDRENIKAALGGTRAGGEVNLEVLKTQVESSATTSINGSFRAIGGVMDRVAISSVDDVKEVMNAFPSKITERDSGRMIVVQSYWSLLDRDNPYAPPQKVIDAARKYYALDAAWRQMDAAWTANMKGFDTSMSPDQDCLGTRMDELRDQLAELRQQIKTCARQVADGEADACDISRARSTTKTKAICPAPPQLVTGETHSAYDYLIYLAPPSKGTVNRCVKDVRAAADQVWSAWIEPVWRAECAGDPDAAHCKSTFKAQVLQAIPVARRASFPLPAGSYTKTCKSCAATMSQTDDMKVSCSCEYWKSSWIFWEKAHWKTTSASYRCTKPPKYANCQGTLTAGDKC